MNNRYGMDEKFNKYFIAPLGVLLVLFIIDIYFMNSYTWIAIAITVVMAVYVIVMIFIYLKIRRNVVDELLDISTHYGQVHKRLIKEIQLPYILLDDEGYIFWMNDYAKDHFDTDSSFNNHISELIPEISDEHIMNLQDKSELLISMGEDIYLVKLEIIEFNMDDNNDLFSGNLIGLVMYDKTEFYKYKTQVEDQKMVIGLVYLDNYDETLNDMEDVKISLLSALLERKIKKYFSAEDGIVRKMDKDKFMVIIKTKSFQNLEAERFTLLSEIKNVNIGEDVTVTISMGFGIDAESYADAMNYASAAIQIALGRGGDQAVIKSPTEQAYYGGLTSEMNRNTRIKARVKAQAFKELVQSAEKVFIMGHKLPDTDAFGAAIGIYKALGKSDERKVHIVLNEISASIKPFVDLYAKEKDLFVTGDEAVSCITAESVLVVVDTNKPSMCDCRELLDKTKFIAVFDHHRMGTEGIKNAILGYIEPYASSTCELVAEMLPYFDDKIKITKDDADCLYAGIVIDTNHFKTKTGVRTFEAAAFLRRNGADVTRVRRMLREDMDSYKYKAEVALNTEVYNEKYAIGICDNEELKSPTVVGAQAANELLNIIGIKASFVLTLHKGIVHISARSEDINVQLIMERMGGGGHMTTAGAQIENCTIDNAKIMLKEAIDQITKERNEQ